MTMGASWIGAGFAAFGLLVGVVCGLSEAKLTTTLLGLLFALIGGSLGALLGKLNAEARKVTGIALLTFSVFTVTGVIGGITIRVNQLLLFESTRTAAAKVESAASLPSVSLKSDDKEIEKFLASEVERGNMTIAQACKVLRRDQPVATAD